MFPYRFKFDSYDPTGWYATIEGSLSYFTDRLTATVEISLDKDMAEKHVSQYFIHALADLLSDKWGPYAAYNPDKPPITLGPYSFAEFVSERQFKKILESSGKYAAYTTKSKLLNYRIIEFKIIENYCLSCGKRKHVASNNFCIGCGSPLPPNPHNQSKKTIPSIPIFQGIPDSVRNLTCYISGSPGTGKSCLIQNLALKDIESGMGVCVIDPTGDLIQKPGNTDAIIDWIPANRINDTIFFDIDNPIPIDFFSYRNPGERGVLTDQLLDIFNLENAPISRPRLQQLLGTLFDANEEIDRRVQKGQAEAQQDVCTFLDILYFIKREDRREQIFKYAPHRREDWTPLPKPNEFVSITERMIPFFESPTLKTMFGAKNPKLNIWDVMQKKQILLVSLKDTATDAFIGSLICSKFQQATFGRRDLPEIERTPYALYIDECHTILKYAVDEFEAILTRARKYNLCLTMANQLPTDLPKKIKEKFPSIRTHIAFTEKFKAHISYPGFNQTIATPTFLSPNPASYATIIKKRTVDSYACNTPQVSHTEVNEHHDKPDEIAADPKPPSVPSHQSKKGNP
jgi:hypothetical protein